MSAMSPEITIAERFNGPPASGNGGYVSGLIAGTADPAVPLTVTLRAPPPLGRPLRLTEDGDRTLVHDAETLVAEANPGAWAESAVPAVGIDVARAAEPHYPGLWDATFQGCFVCGPSREPGDGMRLQPGPIGVGRTACTWTPDASLAGHDGWVANEFVWAALDCPGGWTSDLISRPLVLGRITAQVLRRPAVGEDVVLVGALLSVDGRKTTASVAAYDASQRLLGRSEQVWIEVDPSVYAAD